VTPAFWDSSALVPLCVHQQSSVAARRLLRQYSIVVWWSTSVEMRSAFERLLRMGQSTPAEHRGAITRMERLRRSWRELAPTEDLRAEAETLLGRFPLKGADALQLAAAVTWTGSQPKGRVLISADTQLLDAARQLGFQTVSA